jgi:5-(carboxyamino)imidazole ribonucleotide mutase
MMNITPNISSSSACKHKKQHKGSVQPPRKIGVLMGSITDMPKMQGAIDVLLELGLTPKVQLVSAHKQPTDLSTFARNARNDGYAAIICGAGLAAHLAGFVASNTTLPVVGIPLSTGPLNGIDSLYSTVQMTEGFPVATVGIDNSINAGILVAQFIGIFDAETAEKLESKRYEHRIELRETNNVI